MTDVHDRFADLMAWFVAEGVRDGLMPPVGALTLTVSDGAAVVQVESVMSGADRVSTTVRALEGRP